MTRRHLTTVFALVLAVTIMAAATGCSSLSPNRLPSVRAGVSTDYHVTLQFASVLNLPAGADVMMNGIRIGTVESTSESANGVDVKIGLSDSTRVPADTKAIIRQNTLLGDTYLALTPPAAGPDNSGYLQDGGVVPLARTTSPPTLEDTIAVLAYFVNGGSIQKAQDTMATLNKTMPSIPDVRRMSTTVAKDLDNLAGQTDELDRLIDGMNQTSLMFGRVAPQIAGVFGPEAAHYWDRVATSVVAHISTLLPSVGSIFIGGVWLIPMLRSVAATTMAGRGMWDEAPDAGAELTEFLQSTLLPFAQNPSVNVTSVSGGDGGQLIGDAKNLLRMLGAIR
ncbi:Mce family protein [Gordonia polyisoprenivorans NBRC 16320 = JCM 10675]|uniref:MCE family protein n=1 Tax=Gordonia polyisoprenivorans TaxID=84595 RepID=A0A846WI64_9ACTN|nr:MlaD family protein [Gordonia polyisoprenivorans]NKY01425.1 MCE family protein [Gordonia polyisoprenivorans]GAB26304.1 Mce family protein [Gordonia polyisoprenivorans NBRC 16320 = JCM 10675]